MSDDVGVADPDACKPDDACWLDERVEVRRSRIEGRGLFARSSINQGELVSKLGGRLVDTQTLRRIFETSGSYVDAITVGADQHLVLPPGTPNGFGNHSCDPNLWWEGPFELRARRDIRPGEELTNDYAASTTDPGWQMACACEATTCRHVISGDDCRRLDLVATYEGHVVPAVLSASQSET